MHLSFYLLSAFPFDTRCSFLPAFDLRIEVGESPSDLKGPRRATRGLEEQKEGRGTKGTIASAKSRENDGLTSSRSGKMADIAFGSVVKVIKLALKIQKQVKTVRQNEQECRDIEQQVGTLMGILSPLQKNPEVMMSQPGINAALLSLETTLHRALSLIKDCQESKAMRRLFGAGDMSKKLRRIRSDILEEMVILLVATNVLQVSITLTNTIRYLGAHPALTQRQDSGAAEIAYINHLTTDDARSGVNNVITLLETGSEIPYAPPSTGLTTFSLSESEATIHHVSKENISVRGGHSFMMQQKIVIKVSMPGDRMRSKAMELVAKAAGVQSMGIIGDSKDQLEVLGEGIDIICLMMCLRKKLGGAAIISVEEAKDMKEPEETKVGARKSKKRWAMAFQAAWRQVWQRNKAGATTAAEKGEGRASFGGGRGSRSSMDIAEQAVDNSDEDNAYKLRMSQMPDAPLYRQSQTTPGAGPSTCRYQPKTPGKTRLTCCLVQPRKWVMNQLPVLSVTVGIISAICLIGLIVFFLSITLFGREEM